MISVKEAERLIFEAMPDFGTESIPAHLATGRILAESIVAERDQPPFDRVTMDGVAIRWQENLTTWTITDTQLAGESPKTLAAPDHAIEIMTGAALCDDADTVIPVERYQIETINGQSRLTLETGYQPSHGQNIHKAGSDHAAGTTLLTPGMRIGGIESAIIASAGHTDVLVKLQPSIAVIATGDELVPPGQPIEPHQIRLSNGPALLTALRSHGFSDVSLHHLPDSKAGLQKSLAEILNENEVLVLSGGVSKGKADFVPEILNMLGVKKHFHFVAQRPGKPMWFGTGEQRQAVFALPGNPVSTLSCFRRYVVPALERANGMNARGPSTVKLATDWHFKPALTALVPAMLQPDNAGQMWATPLSTNTSGDFAALAYTDGLIELPPKRKDFACGEAFPFFYW
ncbi:MAG: molybdopterin molybdotransferase MoeA [Woeseiaceae bacterium]